MKKALLLLVFLLVGSALFVSRTFAEEATHPDTVKVGIYVISVHNIDFKQKEYAINLWLWLKYKRADFDFERNLEIPMAKTFDKSFTTIDTMPDGTIYMLMKLQCVMKGTWKINYFPFDHQKLRFSIENSQFDSRQLVFSRDTFGKHYGKYFLNEWEKDSFNTTTGLKEYETSFGDPALTKPHSEYASYMATIAIHRQSWELFFKLFLGMYISFMIACVCFYIHLDNMDSRLALSVGALFAVIGNKYIVDSSLPESNSFTLVDTLHGVTLFYIFLVIASSVITLNLLKKDKGALAEKINRMTGIVTLIAYVVINFWLIYSACNSQALG